MRVSVFLIVEAYVGGEIAVAHRKGHAQGHAMTLGIGLHQVLAVLGQPALARGVSLFVIYINKVWSFPRIIFTGRAFHVHAAKIHRPCNNNISSPTHFRLTAQAPAAAL